MTLRHAFSILLAFAVLSAGAAGPAEAAPAFRLDRFFDGTVRSEGRIRTALVLTEDFTATLVGRLQGRRLTLDERFRFADAGRLQRWDLARGGDGAWRGTVRTEGADGMLSPPAPVLGLETADGIVLDYDGVAPGGTGTPLHFRHTMTAQADGTVRNRVAISRFGLALARADVVFRRVGPR